MQPGERLVDFPRNLKESGASLSALGEVMPGWLVEQAIEEEGRQGQRKRKLPPPVVAWLAVGMSLFRDLSIQNVLRKLVVELDLEVSWGPTELPHKTSVTQARDRLGWRVLRTLFFKFVNLLLGRFPAADLWKGLPTYVIDGSCFVTADSNANEAEFGRPGTGRGKSGYPQFRGVVLVGAFSHFVLGAMFGAWKLGELTLAQSMLSQIPTRCLLLVDRLYYAYAWLSDLDRRGSYFLVRAKVTKKGVQMVRSKKRRGRNEWLATLKPSRKLRKQRPDSPSELTVRLIECKRKGFRSLYLVTNLLDREEYTAQEIIELFADRWEVELSLREIKCVLGSNKRPLFRSKKPDRVRQEAYGLLIAYNCVRALMAEAAEVAGVRPRQLSFSDCLLLARTMLILMAQADPLQLVGLYQTLLDQMAQCVLPKRRKGRRCPRAVKVKMSGYARKRNKAA